MVSEDSFRREYEKLPQLGNQPRAELGLVKTSIDSLPRLSAELGINLLIKRDDTLPLAMGGNKHRQLEYYFGQAQSANADTILITGAIQSNFVRLCAAAAIKTGLHPVIQLEDRVPSTDEVYNNSGNVMLDRLMGAEIHYFSEGEDEAAADANLDAIADGLRKNGRKPYVIHLGMSHPPYGGMGYALCAAETMLQLSDIDQAVDHVIVPSGSGLTHCGFVSGARGMGWDVDIHGICVRRPKDTQQVRIAKRFGELMELLEIDYKASTDDLRVDDTVLAPGYGQLNKHVVEAINLAARKEAIFLDPVYSGRTMAGLISKVRSGEIKPGQSVLFIHTGGAPAIFAYENKLRSYPG